jgi:hypothetical protein
MVDRIDLGLQQVDDGLARVVADEQASRVVAIRGRPLAFEEVDDAAAFPLDGEDLCSDQPRHHLI